MDINLLWEFIQKNSSHIEIINKELSVLIAQVEWLTWMIRGLIFGTGITVLLLIINIWLTKKNGKK